MQRVTSFPPADPSDQPSTERQALEEFLDYFRAVLRRKGEDLDEDQANTRACPPSQLTIVGLVRHMVEVERYWFACVLGGQKARGPYSTKELPDEDIVPSAPASIEQALGALDAEIGTSRTIAIAHDLDAPTAPRKTGAVFNLRWIYVHLIEEYARHCGHADLLREAIDGRTGD